ncbi:hypothetical protein Cri9333_4835 (plasmid) [Crinalium epipsammum PCC 9333]|uniref:Uncharacterized protein n=1 Tax=Crinalium epipsammum PCC 9333 TaxID=1173022 RepID=K9W5Z9_9CYAN|nr:hypothetical protein [Crinalium epipsammum]AFZ15601.1 hypothetical protein Cri9333_4835 [Crinalium epipsammum PCC 9333]
MHRPSYITEQKWQQIYSFIHAKTRMTPQQFVSKWGVTSGFIAELCHCNESTVANWINGNFGDSSSQRPHQLKLFIADLMLSDFEGLPEKFKSLFCPDWQR